LFLAVALFSGALLPSHAWARTARAAFTSRAWRLAVYIAGAAVTIVALRLIGSGIDPGRALLAGRVAAFGLAGAGVYALIWIEGAWPAGTTLTMLATRGAIVGFFVEILSGAEIANAGAARLLVAALAIGATARHSMRGTPTPSA
jgi:hypothetical protein